MDWALPGRGPKRIFRRLIGMATIPKAEAFYKTILTQAPLGPATGIA
jgi:hypothetical protein